MTTRKYQAIFIFAIFCFLKAYAGPAEAVDSLVDRILPSAASSFTYAVIPADSGRDVFELDYSGGKVVIRGNNANSMAQGLNYYLKYYCNVHFSLNGNQTTLPLPLPAVQPAVHLASPHRYRYLFNYCTYNYSLSYWTWNTWEQFLDWMALNGINLALAGVYGQEAVWQNTLRHFGYTDAEIYGFIPGPAWNAWWLMGNLEGWGGPVPQALINARLALEQNIVARMRQLGIEPVLQGFYGMVPTNLSSKYPANRIFATGTWCGYTRPAMIDPIDTLFTTMADVWYAEQKTLFGDAKFFGGDPFHEGGSASINLTTAGTRIQQGMIRANPNAVWVLQGWQTNPADAMLSGTIKAQTLILDLFGETNPQWSARNGWNGHPWLWNCICNFGGKVGLYGPMGKISSDPVAVFGSTIKGNYSGIGGMPEGICTNSAVWDLLFDMGWRTTAPDLTDWLAKYSTRRYGKVSGNCAVAWSLLAQSVYKYATSDGGDPESFFCARPAATINNVSSWGTTARQYCNLNLIDAWKLLCADTANLAGVATYEHDLVDVTRQLMANYAMPLHSQMIAAYNARDRATFVTKSTTFLQCILDQDTLLATRPSFLLGRWLEDAKSWGSTVAEKNWYEWTARTLITTWGPRAASESGGLHEYAHREWSGILGTLYYSRWKMYIDDCITRLDGGTGRTFNWFSIDSAWCSQHDHFPSTPQGNAVAAVRKIAAKYNFEPDYSTVGIAYCKPVTASSYEPGYPPDVITDGATTGSYWGAGPYPQWVTIDLRNTARIDSIRVFPYADGTRYYQYRIEVSLDGTNWMLVADLTGNTQPATAQGRLSVLSPPRNARHIRVTMTRNSANTSVHLYEVRVFGVFIVPVVNKPVVERDPVPRIIAGNRRIAVAVDGHAVHIVSVFTLNGHLIKSFSGSGRSSYAVTANSGVYLITVKQGKRMKSYRVIVR